MDLVATLYTKATERKSVNPFTAFHFCAVRDDQTIVLQKGQHPGGWLVGPPEARA